MSRIGKMPIAVPKGVQITVAGEAVTIKGPKGQLQVDLLPGVTAALDEGQLNVSRADDSAPTRSYHGLIRSLVANAAIGVSEGWSKELEIVGIGYRAENKGASVMFNLGYSHPIDFAIPAGIEIVVEPKTNKVKVTGFDRQQVGQVAADIRALRPPEPYKGKGIRYANERIRIKAGKQGASS